MTNNTLNNAAGNQTSFKFGESVEVEGAAPTFTSGNVDFDGVECSNWTTGKPIMVEEAQDAKLAVVKIGTPPWDNSFRKLSTLFFKNTDDYTGSKLNLWVRVADEDRDCEQLFIGAKELCDLAVELGNPGLEHSGLLFEHLLAGSSNLHSQVCLAHQELLTYWGRPYRKLVPVSVLSNSPISEALLDILDSKTYEGVISVLKKLSCRVDNGGFPKKYLYEGNNKSSVRVENTKITTTRHSATCCFDIVDGGEVRHPLTISFDTGSNDWVAKQSDLVEFMMSFMGEADDLGSKRESVEKWLSVVVPESACSCPNGELANKLWALKIVPISIRRWVVDKEVFDNAWNVCVTIARDTRLSMNG